MIQPLEGGSEGVSKIALLPAIWSKQHISVVVSLKFSGFTKGILESDRAPDKRVVLRISQR